jgi:hypothetical protein
MWVAHYQFKKGCDKWFCLWKTDQHQLQNVKLVCYTYHIRWTDLTVIKLISKMSIFWKINYIKCEKSVKIASVFEATNVVMKYSCPIYVLSY